MTTTDLFGAAVAQGFVGTIKCPTCRADIGEFDPEDSQAGGLLHTKVREHRRIVGCPDKHACLLLIQCRACPDTWLLPVLTTSATQGEVYMHTLHPHLAKVHRLDKRRK